MRLYTIQPLCIYDQLVNGDPFLSYPLEYEDSWLLMEPISKAYLIAYNWMVAKMEEAGLSRPAPTAYPVWAYHKPKPDLRHSHYKYKRREVLMGLDIDDRDVILHDDTYWTVYALNYWYCGNLKEDNAFQRKLRQHGFQSNHDLLQVPDHELNQELRASWEIIFDLERVRRRAQCRRDSQVINATFWTLRPEQVVSAVAFGANRKKERLPVPTQARRVHAQHPEQAITLAGNVRSVRQEPEPSAPLTIAATPALAA